MVSVTCEYRSSLVLIVECPKRSWGDLWMNAREQKLRRVTVPQIMEPYARYVLNSAH
jgi:hypothetical protein